MKKKVGRKATGLKNSKPFEFKWNVQGLKLLKRAAKDEGISQAAYIRLAVSQRAGL